MGGYGSGHRWGGTRITVESCLSLSADKLTRDRLIGRGRHNTGSLTWTNTATGEPVGNVSYLLDTREGWPPTLRLLYNVGEARESMDYPVRLTTTPTPWGALRWWFICPLSRNGVACGRRSGKLHLPSGGKWFGCRLCYNLTYTSSNESNKHGAILSMIAARLGGTLQDVRRALRPRKSRR